MNPYKLTKPKIDGISCLTSVIGFGGIVFGVSLTSEFGFSVPVINWISYFFQNQRYKSSSLIPNATFIEMQYLGHIPMVEEPKTYNNIIDKFLNK